MNPVPAPANEALPVAEVKHEGLVDFEREILPLLRRNCIACHSTSSPESDLVLETPQSILEGGSEGPGVVPGNAEQSLVFQLAAHQRESFMPPEGNRAGAKKLTPIELGLLKLWIDQGAKGAVTGESMAINWQPLPPGYNPIYSVAVSSHGQYVAAGRANQIFMYSIPSRESLGRLTDPELIQSGIYKKPGVAHLDLVQSLAFSPVDERLASGGFRNVKIWQHETGVRQKTLSAAEADIRDLTATQDGKLAAIVEATGTVRLYDVSAGSVLRTLSAPIAGLTSVDFSPDKSRIITGSRDKTVRIWNVADGQEVGKLETPSAVTAALFVLDGTIIVTAGSDNVLRTWATPRGAASETLAPVQEMTGHGAPVIALARVPTAPSQIVSASLDGTARLWDVVKGTQVRQYAHGPLLSSVAVRADGKRIATGAETGVVKLWNAENGEQIAELSSESGARYEFESINLAIELARRHLQNAKSDLQEANTRKQTETENADKAAVELVRAEHLVKQKAEATLKPVADKEAAEKELAELKAEVPKLEAAKQASETQQTQAVEALAKARADRETKTKAVADADAALKKAQAEKASADRALAEAQAEIKAAQEDGDSNTISAAEGASKATKEKQSAADRALKEAEATKASADQAKMVADKGVTDADVAQKSADQAKQQADNAVKEITQKIKAAEQKVSQLTPLAQKALDEKRAAEGGLESTKRAVELALEAVARASSEIPQMQARLVQREQQLRAEEDRLTKMQQIANRKAALLRDLEGEMINQRRTAVEAQNRLVAAQTARNAALAALVAAREKRLMTLSEQAQGVANANKAMQEVLAAKDTTEKALEDAQGRLEAAQAGGDQAKVEAATAEVKSAAEKKTVAEQSLAHAETALQNAVNQATKANAAAQNVVSQAYGPFAIADNALGGAKAVAETAAAHQAQLETQLRDAQATLTAATDDVSMRTQSAIVQDLAIQHAEAAKAAAEAAVRAKSAADAQATAFKGFVAASTALNTAADGARKAVDQGQQLVKTATDAKTRADQEATDSTAVHEAAVMSKEAAQKALTAAQEQLNKAQDDVAKAVAAVELQNATRRNVAADEIATAAEAALNAANSAKSNAEKALADARKQAQQMQEAASKALADARNAYHQALNQRSQAEAESGGALARAATSAELQTEADRTLARERKPIRTVAFSPSGAQLAMSISDGMVYLFSSDGGEPLGHFAAADRGLIAATYVADDQILTAADNKSLAIWSSRPVWKLERMIGSINASSPFVDRVTALDFSPCGNLLATGGGIPSRSGELKLWDVATGQLMREISDAHSDTIFGVTFSPDGKHLATCGGDRFMKVFEVESGKLVKTFEGHTHHVLGVNWRADGRLLVTGGADNVVKVWDFATGEQLRTIQGFEKEITAVEFLGVSDSFVITTGANQVVTRRTDGGTGPNFSGAKDFMYNVRASQDGKTVAAGGLDSVLRVWDQQGKLILAFEPPPADSAQQNVADQPTAKR